MTTLNAFLKQMHNPTVPLIPQGCKRDASARPDPASAGAEAPPALPHIITRVSTRTCRERESAPREAPGEAHKARRAPARLDSRRHTPLKAACRRPAAQRAALAARGQAWLVEACKGVKQAHAVGGWWVSEGARARRADGSPD